MNRCQGMKYDMLTPESWSLGSPRLGLYTQLCIYIACLYDDTHTHIYIHTDMYVRGNVRACSTRSRVCNVMQAAPVTFSSLHLPAQVWWRLRAIKSSLLHEQFLLITSTQPTVANDLITSVVPPFLSPPPPPSLFFAPPLSSSSHPPLLVYPSLWMLPCLCWCQHRDMPRRPRGPSASLWIFARGSICIFVFCSQCPLVYLTHSLFLCSHIQSFLYTAELMNLIST